jgi:hypothetical protein
MGMKPRRWGENTSLAVTKSGGKTGQVWDELKKRRRRRRRRSFEVNFAESQ